MNGTNDACAMGPWARIDATWRLATASRLVRVVLAMAALACMMAPVAYARVTPFDHGGGFYLGPDGDSDGTPAGTTTTTLTFAQVLERQPDEAWQWSVPAVILLLLAWEGLAYRRARRSVPARPPRGQGARLTLLLVWLLWVAVVTFDLFPIGDWSASAGATVKGLACIGATAGAILDIVLARRIATCLRRFEPAALPEARARVSPTATDRRRT